MIWKLFLPLLLAISVVSAADVPEAEQVTSATEAQEQAQVTGAIEAQEQTQTIEGAKLISGMSILGNQETPKSLVIVPWKSSEIGDSLGISTMLDDSRQPVDKEVFMRALSYYEIRSETTQ
jgi:hypothetical protein